LNSPTARARLEIKPQSKARETKIKTAKTTSRNRMNQTASQARLLQRLRLTEQPPPEANLPDQIDVDISNNSFTKQPEQSPYLKKRNQSETRNSTLNGTAK
jgi:hypothetical protein